MQTRAYWNRGEHTTDTEFTPYLLRHGRRMHKLLRIICRVEFPDRIDIPSDRPIIFVANHRSFLDIAVASALFAHLELSCRFQVQARMFDRGVVGVWLTKLGCIPTNKAVSQQAEDTSVKTLDEGHTIAIMPEGRLVPPADRPTGVGPGRPGLSRIARRANAVAVPVACCGTEKVWPRGRPIPRLGLLRRATVSVEFGEPIEFRGNDHQRNVDEVMDAIALILTRRDGR
ncbi:MAG: lysophospholipid acyltransferase family protein [Acidimicrobiales bacterium]